MLCNVLLYLCLGVIGCKCNCSCMGKFYPIYLSIYLSIYHVGIIIQFEFWLGNEHCPFENHGKAYLLTVRTLNISKAVSPMFAAPRTNHSTSLNKNRYASLPCFNEITHFTTANSLLLLLCCRIYLHASAF